jgi:hypothetical protein
LSVIGVQAAVTAAVLAADLANSRVVVARTTATAITFGGSRYPPMERTIAALTRGIGAASLSVAATTATAATASLACVALAARCSTSPRARVAATTRTPVTSVARTEV